MICKHCGSKYTEFRSKKESFGKTINTFYCQSCKRYFTDDVAQNTANGQWLMTFRSSKPAIGGRDIAEVYRKSDGSYEINIKYQGKCFVSRGPLNFSVKRITALRTVYHLWVDTFRSTFDSNGIIITVEEIELNPQLTQDALKNNAMKALHKRDNLFVIHEQQAPTLLNDVVAWVCPALGGKINKPKTPRPLILAIAIILTIIFIAAVTSGGSSSSAPWKDLGVSQREYMDVYNSIKYGR